MRLPALLLAALALVGCAGESFRDTTAPIAAQQDFDPERYLGLWYEIARFPVRFQEGCTATTAEYGAVIPPFLAGCIRRIHTAIFSFCAGVMPPMPMFGRSLL